MGWVEFCVWLWEFEDEVRMDDGVYFGVVGEERIGLELGFGCV